MIHLKESHQLKHGYWSESQGPCPKGLFSDTYYMTKTWTSDRLASVESTTKVTVHKIVWLKL